VALVITDVSEERSASITRVTGIGELGTMLAVTSNRPTLPNVLPFIIPDDGQSVKDAIVPKLTLCFSCDCVSLPATLQIE
jgi:hypothetical protein